MNEQYYDAVLNIKTVGEQKGFYKSLHYHRYEPTPYRALETLFTQYDLKSSDRVVDFGCGKGRLNFYIHHFYHASVVGVEMNETFYQEALENRDRYIKKDKKGEDKIHFQCCLAQEYEINPFDNKFYFFNPFSVEQVEREVELILYYPSEGYIYFLDNQTSFELKEEVILPGLYERNSNERFLVYRLGY